MDRDPPVQTVGGIFHSYAAIFFIPHRWIGGLFLLSTLLVPNSGLSGLIAVITAAITVQLFRLNERRSGYLLYNPLLVGLSLGASYSLTTALLPLILISALFTVFVTASLSSLLWRLQQLPVLSLPFVVVAMIAHFAAHNLTTLTPLPLPGLSEGPFIYPPVDAFLTALGSALFTPNPQSGALLFVGLLITSRYLALLSIAAFAAGWLTLHALVVPPQPVLLIWSGFNLILSALAIALFTRPGAASFITALLGSIITALLISASQSVLSIYGLPIMAIPFLVTTFTLLAALTNGATDRIPVLFHPTAELPEVEREHQRLLRARFPETDSIPLRPPFIGSWQIYQGFDGPHTHQQAWRYALDFHITEQGRSYHHDGNQLTNHYCFGLPVLSPTDGVVEKVVDERIDNPPGEIDTERNWGNYLVIKMENGCYVLLAHLRRGSIQVQEGQTVHGGQSVAACGNSGRSTQPHLHLHLQVGPSPGSATIPFHFNSVLLHNNHYRLFARPQQGEWITHAERNERLARALHLPVGLQLHYQWEGEQSGRHTLEVKLTLFGQFRLQSDHGASIAFEERDGVIACYDRKGPADRFLDLWLLTFGLTPLSDHARQWQDEPSLRQLPLPHLQRLLTMLRYPMGGGLDSRYQRQINPTQHTWLQQGEHTLSLLRKKWKLTTRGELCPHRGFASLEATIGNQQWQATLISSERTDIA